MTDNRKFDMNVLMMQATAHSGGLSDFGDAHFRPALHMMLASLDRDARLSEQGRSLLQQRLVELLSNRLQVEAYCKRHPDILDEVIVQPVVIVGLPRTGTTLLQRILARDPRFYSLAWWESRHPVPQSEVAPDSPDPRIAQARAEVEMMIAAMPQLLSIHPLDAEQADEEVMLMEHTFFGAMDAYANVSSYTAWREGQDYAPAYTYLKKLLQFMQWQKKRRGMHAERWVLKTPHHLHAMPALFKLFPDVRVIQTHRDPLQTIPSLASFVHTLWRIYSDHADAATAGQQWNRQFARSLRHTMQFRDALPEPRFFDVAYIDTVKQPMDVVRAIYAFLGMPLTDGVEALMRQWLTHNARDQRAPHDYSVAQFGLSNAQLEQDYLEYRARYLEQGNIRSH
ncbi:sulfotransferase family protein [Noviherbaspirillum saxi]|uniref:Sulfotransferase n=1 Tax=Noviherbaspirillum saxi TaxID=2320863 RepID=A0A3A3G3A5_9BURK|nr:sulfotransferase [Noviherbaspirillum saxi]RJF92553.1 sulfotransferase [Noviherbaspirillum saxi]